MTLHDICKILIAAMLPVVEIRGALPLALAYGFSPLPALFLCVCGNMFPIPILILFSRKVLRWLKRFPRMHSFALRLENRAHRNSVRVMRCAFWGLIILVAIPLPGTGAWTGALVASLLDMRLRNSLPAIFLGVCIAGLIMLAVSMGVRIVF